MMSIKETLSLAGRIDAIEAAYEFMLAYAAQGRQGHEGGPTDEIRSFLEQAITAIDGLSEAYADRLASEPDASATAGHDFRKVLEEDVQKARAAIRLALVQPAISSQLVDNLNASIHLRALLTDLFILDASLSKGAGDHDGAVGEVPLSS